MGSKVTVIRHPRENLKKCSLRHLHGRADFEFFKATENFLFDAGGFILLEIGAPAIAKRNLKPNPTCTPTTGKSSKGKTLTP